MNRFTSIPLGSLFLCCASLMTLSSDGMAAEPHRLRRSDAFLGIHFDFHAGPDCNEVGKNTTREMVENILRQVHPDYLQIDCKGHPGLSSYPTKVGNQAPGFVGDPLKLWRQVTAEQGVSLYMHYSGVWDSEAIRQHPDWGVVNANGSVNGNATSFYSPYADRLLLPQLRELAGDYGVDGAWVDGECWASAPDYRTQAVEAFQSKTGIATAPRKRTDPGWFEFLEFNRDLFRTYLRRNVAEMKRTHPKFEFCSNWAFTDHMPEPVSIPMDFLSGDYSPEDSVNSARLSARYLAEQGKPWDLMAWSFTTKPSKDGRSEKTAIQLQREAAVVVALGGGFQAYFTQKRDGSIREERLPVMGEVAAFCRERQKVCHHAKPVPQIALLFSTHAHYRRVSGLFSRDASRIAGTLNALLDGQHSVELTGEHHLRGRMQEYPLIIVAENQPLANEFKEELLNYARKGGNLLVVGAQNAVAFQEELGVSIANPERPAAELALRLGAESANLKAELAAATLGTSARALGAFTVTGGNTTPLPLASVAKLGKGRIAATYVTLGQAYFQNPTSSESALLSGLVRELFPRPLVEVSGSREVDVSLMTKAGLLNINLVNSSGPHRTEPILDTIPPTPPLSIALRTSKKPKSARLEPGGQPLPVAFAKGVATISVPPVPVHSIVVVDPR